MTVRHLVPVTVVQLERLAFNARKDIEIDNVNDRAFVRIDSTTFVAELGQEPTC